MNPGEITITRLVAPNPGPLTGPGTNSFVVGDTTGCVVIDPGVDDQMHLDAIASAATALGNTSAIIVTHGHPDHLGGADHLASMLSAPILALDHSANGVPSATRTLVDGETIAAGAQSLVVLATPGHRFDHLCLYHAATETLFAGDLMAGVGTVVIIPPEGDMRAYLDSLARLRSMPLRRIWPGHGPAIDNPQARIDDYIAHRLDREAQVVAALTAASPQTVTALVPTVYRDTDPSLYAWAAKSLLAHLLKLEADGRMTRDTPDDEGPWRLI